MQFQKIEAPFGENRGSILFQIEYLFYFRQSICMDIQSSFFFHSLILFFFIPLDVYKRQVYTCRAGIPSARSAATVNVDSSPQRPYAVLTDANGEDVYKRQDSNYPLTINREEEQMVREAAKQVNICLLYTSRCV